MKVLITGGGGQLAEMLVKTCPPDKHAVAASRQDLDVTDAEGVTRMFERRQIRLVINCAAYTAVDEAESQRDRAFDVNAAGAENVARAARQTGARMIQISTDFVFGGQRATPCRVDDEAAPVNIYGASKLAGEIRASDVHAGGVAIVRTSWLYASTGRNFVTSMLHLMRERDHLDIVVDQIGGPTWARALADVIWRISELSSAGTYHWSDAGVASWYDFALAIQEEAMQQGLLSAAIPVRPVMTEDYRPKAKRPAYSVLDCRATQAELGVAPAHWRTNLRRMLAEMANA